MTREIAPSPERGSFLDQKPRSPTGLAIVLLMHGAAIGALLLAKGPEIMEGLGPIEIIDVPIEKPPEPNVEPQPEPKQQKSVIETVPPVVPVPRQPDRPFVSEPQPVDPPIFDRRPIAEAEIPRVEPRPTPPPPMPVRTEADIDPRFAGQLQPPYPASEERAGNQGTVAIKVTIGPDGRVKQTEKVRATSEAFWRATERHARSSWRFKPATVDGRPVESHKVMTVHFEIKD